MKSYPPLWVWLVSATIILLGVLLLQFSFSPREKMIHLSFFATFTHQMNNFLADYEPKPEQYRVICWGSSLSRQAIENSDVLHDRIISEGADIDVQKMYMSGAYSHFFPYLNELFEVSETLKPDLILIEDQMFAFTSKSGKHIELVKHFKIWLKELIQGPARVEIHASARNKNFDNFYAKSLFEQGKDTLNPSFYERSILDFSEHKEIVRKLAFAQEQGIPIVVVNVPRAGGIEKKMITAEKQVKIDELIQSYRALGFQIDYWKFPEYLPHLYYHDNVHMNARGRQVYSKWLAGRITKVFKAQSLQ